MILVPRSCPSSPGFAITTLIFRATTAESSLAFVELKGVVWVGTRTAQFDEMAAFAEGVLGLERVRGEDGRDSLPLQLFGVLVRDRAAEHDEHILGPVLA